ncbi:urate hydroxylase PuuD [Radicibacter daui]|uniref:urate hydroxylase PuuD n=1 Tax=Radicibacter daui TaxID=3064829 RepID=UPI004046A898
MGLPLLDWANLLFRWAHIIVGIAWIGSSFYFMFLDATLRKREGQDKGVLGETWQVHGGGFYFIQKYLVAPERMPSELHWFKYEAYATWITGICLLVVVYYFGANAFLIDGGVMRLTPFQAIFLSVTMLAGGWVAYEALCRSDWGKDTGKLAIGVFVLITFAAWLFAHTFSGRAAFIHVGALVGTIMAANVFVIIIPNQKKVVAALMRGEAPDPKYGKIGKQRSVHNNYLTLPVILMMISNHYPMLTGHPLNWAIIPFIVVIGGLIRHYYNTKNSGVKTPWLKVYVPVAAVLFVALAFFVAWRPGAEQQTAAAPGGVDMRQVFAVVRTRCSACHSAFPYDDAITVAPAGVKFDSPAEVEALADRIYQQAGLNKTMPLGNKTGMTEEERALIRQWHDERTGGAEPKAE